MLHGSMKETKKYFQKVNVDLRSTIEGNFKQLLLKKYEKNVQEMGSYKTIDCIFDIDDTALITLN